MIQKKPYILIVDDNVTVLTTLRQRLSREGFEVVTATNGTYAVKAVERVDFCCVLIDVTSAEAHGLEFVAELRRTHFLPLPIWAMMEDYNVELRATLAELRVDRVLMKPQVLHRDFPAAFAGLFAGSPAPQRAPLTVASSVRPRFTPSSATWGGTSRAELRLSSTTAGGRSRQEGLRLAGNHR